MADLLSKVKNTTRKLATSMYNATPLKTTVDLTKAIKDSAATRKMATSMYNATPLKSTIDLTKDSVKTFTNIGELIDSRAQANKSEQAVDAKLKELGERYIRERTERASTPLNPTPAAPRAIDPIVKSKLGNSAQTMISQGQAQYLKRMHNAAKSAPKL